MKRLLVYVAETGDIERIVSPVPPQDALRHYTIKGRDVLETDQQHIDTNVHAVRDGKLVSRSSEEIDVRKNTEAKNNLRRSRDQLLRTQIDAINPMLWEEMTELKRQEWRNYRRQLLDLPQNTPDPRSPIWPKKPDE